MAWKLALFVAVSIGLHFVFRWGGRLLPQHQPADVSDWPPEMLAAVARRANFWGTLAAFLSFLILLPLWMGGTYWLDFQLLPHPGPGELVSVQLNWGRWLRAPVAAYVLASFVAFWVMRLAAGWRYDFVMAAGNRFFGFDARAFFYLAIVWILPFCFEFELHSLGNSAHFASTGLVIRDSLLTSPHEHSYQQLQPIELAQPYTEDPAAIFRSPECRLKFQDGFVFTDQAWIYPWDDRNARHNWPATCDFVSRQSGRPITVVRKIK